VNSQLLACVGTASASYHIKQILWRKGKSTNKVKENDPAEIEQGDEAEIIFEPYNRHNKLAIETYKDCSILGRVCFLNCNELVMLGRITELIN